jgi:hypothetical protein
MVLADIKVKANIYQNRVRIITSSMNPDSPSTISCTCTEASEHRQSWTTTKASKLVNSASRFPPNDPAFSTSPECQSLSTKKSTKKKPTYQSSAKTDPSTTTTVKEFNYNSSKRWLRRIKGIQRNSPFTASPTRLLYISTTQTLHRDDHHQLQPIQTD